MKIWTKEKIKFKKESLVYTFNFFLKSVDNAEKNYLY